MTHDLDLRAILAQGIPPIGPILEAAAGIAQGDTLRLLAPFEPVPLYERLANEGFEHSTRTLPGGLFEIAFTRVRPPPVPTTPDEPSMQVLDLRDLEPPGPMQHALEALAAAAPGQVFVVHTRFRPVHLLTLLDERRVLWETEEQPDGSWQTFIAAP